MDGYSYFIIENFIRIKLNSIFEPTIFKPDVPKQKIFVKIPFMSAHSNKLIKFDLSKLVSKFYPQIDFNIIFTNDFSIGSFFQFKDKVSPYSMRYTGASTIFWRKRSYSEVSRWLWVIHVSKFQWQKIGSELGFICNWSFHFLSLLSCFLNGVCGQDQL